MDEILEENAEELRKIDYLQCEKLMQTGLFRRCVLMEGIVKNEHIYFFLVASHTMTPQPGSLELPNKMLRIGSIKINLREIQSY